ncbi:MAG: MBL fold metallo-hydrolase [Gemmatimonadetes bacterium]|nr:MBL fold metallo-hydrolase [Gemmatimonadota bacterium]NNM05976.1 MBL fold metallo-hydrolase [Gemmatimonadota bacterium]
MRNWPMILPFFLILCLSPPGGVQGLQDWDSVEIQVSPIRGGVNFVTAAGGNLAAFVGPDGVLVVDADYAEMSDRLISTVKELAGSDTGIRFLVNTHWHFDHTSGNEAFAAAGATIIAHEGVARLLSADQVMAAVGGREVPAAPESARPSITFNDRMNLTLNGDVIHMVHMPDAHSNGDVIVHFRDADVIHMGDLFFNGRYPFIDVDQGGNISGMIQAVEEVLDHSLESTVFIPGHGPLADRDNLLAYREMLTTVRDRVRALLDAGMSRDEVIAEKPTEDLDEIWGSGLTGDRLVGLVFDGMSRGG